MVCYIRHKSDHFANQCPEQKRDRVVNNQIVTTPSVKGHVYYISGEEASTSSELFQGECLIAEKLLIFII